jgi:hypothetical protein
VAWLVEAQCSIRKVAGSIADDVTGFLKWPNLSSRIMALVSTQLLTELNTINTPEGKGRPNHNRENLTAICEPIF